MKKKSSVVPVPSALPPAAGLNVDALSQVFDSTATSYKFLWMLGLLDVLEENDFKPGGIPASRVVLHMLRHADDPIRRFHLSLGAQDRIARHLHTLCELAASASHTRIERLIEGNPAFESVQRELLLYVPQRCLTPFFPELIGVQNGRDKEIRGAADRCFAASSPPLYRLDGGRLDGKRGEPLTVVFNRRWLAYFRRNVEIIRGWAFWHWAGYLEARNPNVPGIIAKIARPESRESIGRQRKFWGAVIGELGGIPCIYSGKILREEADYDLDHFIPWSYAGHNNLWNLVPALKEANMRKSDSLPADKYLEKMVDVQRRALTVYREKFQRKKWEELMNPYQADLKVDPREEWGQDALVEKYREVVPSTMQLAKNKGFDPDWDYDAPPEARRTKRPPFAESFFNRPRGAAMRSD